MRSVTVLVICLKGEEDLQQPITSILLVIQTPVLGFNSVTTLVLFFILFFFLNRIFRYERDFYCGLAHIIIEAEI